MKSEKGVTLISITIYLIAMTIVIGIIATVSDYFFSNVNTVNDTINPMVEYSKFNSFFSDEVNQIGIKVIECGTTNNNQNYIVFDNGVQYTYIPENEAVYRNQVRIAEGIQSCTFTEGIQNGKNIVEVVFKSGDNIRENIYTLKN